MFDVKITDGASDILILTDNIDTPIVVNEFEDIIKTYHRGSMFYVNVQYESTNVNRSLAVVTPMVRNCCEVKFDVFLESAQESCSHNKHFATVFFFFHFQALENFFWQRNAGAWRPFVFPT